VNLPALLVGVLALFGLLVAPIGSGVLLAIARSRRDRLCEPHCRACGTLLDFEAATGLAPCRGCNRPISESGEPRVGRGSRRIWLIVASVGTLVFGWACASLTSLFMTVSGSVIIGPGQRPAVTIIRDAIAGRGIYDNDAIALSKRAADGEDVVGLARTELSGAIQLAPRVDGRPTMLPAVATGEGPARAAAVALLGPDFLNGGAPLPRAELEKPEVRALADDILFACFPRADVDMQSLTTQPALLRPSVAGFESRLGDLRRVMLIRRVLIDGREVAIVPFNRDDADGPALFRFDMLHRLVEPIGKNAKRITVEFEARLYDGLDADRLFDVTGRVLPVERWPTPITSALITKEVELPGGAETTEPK
jgi:hypothetical protein